MSGPAARLSWQARLLKVAAQLWKIRSQRITDVEAGRRAQDRFGASFKPPGEVVITPVTIAGLNAEWLVPLGAPSDRAILYLHGGAYTAGSLTSHRALVARLTQAAGLRALNVEYRLAPEHPFPAALEDAVAAYLWLLDQGVEGKHLVLAGDSAGGGLAVSTLIRLRDLGLTLPAGAALFSPWTDLTDASGSWARRAKAEVTLTAPALHLAAGQYVGTQDLRTPLASPTFAELSGLPPLLIQAGGDELLLNDIQAFADRLMTSNVAVQLEIWPGMFHVWQMMASVMPEARRAISQAGRFLHQISDG